MLVQICRGSSTPYGQWQHAARPFASPFAAKAPNSATHDMTVIATGPATETGTGIGVGHFRPLDPPQHGHDLHRHGQSDLWPHQPVRPRRRPSALTKNQVDADRKLGKFAQPPWPCPWPAAASFCGAVDFRASPGTWPKPFKKAIQHKGFAHVDGVLARGVTYNTRPIRTSFF